MAGCSSCTTTKNGLPRGCKNNGACETGSCSSKLQVFDWLSNMQQNFTHRTSYVLVRFKNDRRDFYKNVEGLSLSIGDVVVVSANHGYDLGVVILKGPLVEIQMRKKKTLQNDLSHKIHRKASEEDIKKWRQARSREQHIMVQARVIAKRLELEMKISDVELQGDATKAIFYYIANDRVDFRKLIKEFASSFRLKIEMRQIGFRQEAAKIGGIGSCGRELCCSSWLTDFRSVNTSAARYQQLSINPQKIAGQCGKLKCCLNYELDAYMDALKDFPTEDVKLQTNKGMAIVQKIDIFKKELWYAYQDAPVVWHKLTVDMVKHIVMLNQKGQKVSALEDFTISEHQANQGSPPLNLDSKADELVKAKSLISKKKVPKKVNQHNLLANKNVHKLEKKVQDGNTRPVFIKKK